MKKTLLLVFIHGFKGTDHTFQNFPKDLKDALAISLPKIDVLTIQYPQFETRGDLKDCVARFKEWLQNKVIDLEVANSTPSPTVHPSVHVVLCGHSMGGIVAAEALLSIAKDEPVSSSLGGMNPTAGHNATMNEPSNPPNEPSRLFFPHVQAILAFDTPYLGISPGVLAHGAEAKFNQSSQAYKAWDQASSFFGWNSPKSASSTPIANASSKGLPAPNSTTAAGGSKWGKYAMYGAGAAAVIAGAAGATYLSWNQISQGLTWAGSHLEFVGCLARGAELQKRVENVVDLTKTHGVGFANFYGALDEKITSQTKYAGAFLGDDRTFCVIPKNARNIGSPTGSKRDLPRSRDASLKPKKRKAQEKEADAAMEGEMEQGEKVREYADDTSKSKGRWVKCVNPLVHDELTAHTSMFTPAKNSDYRTMIPRAKDQILEWILVDSVWYETSGEQEERRDEEENATAGDEPTMADEKDDEAVPAER
ncbi:hypothetical protein CLAFUW4_03106 [Fulvia fulva]|uniref:AB hydrolase-1 domain-containing protein n=1 Tax=Passalora fulva TaxID=5499 RepID=A0A9Q8P549_PASFU|nr:uncharacterized protein CLAFUR5_03090 [Fulvia fulva]KAK4631026.1 hypothetical protein CLAFUR4_03099 [Fulvia fulva]KAK4633110.1 hypothetical protein CLAFUR0_03102 [Fulvia fulva]UJO13544.1 hypothetical protein CLAFUR5_03090 [Fulvia fulva]WPV11646.1 hypothetical protein CLAFUW4_03106 [Fulvia fulva]WPV26754.1 hypothetical protein CLAFUW7_03103 [Fulvia fulva]